LEINTKKYNGVWQMKFEKITACLDMYGCPNRCKHCWPGHTPNGNLTIDDLIFVAEQFRPFTDNLEVTVRYIFNI